MQQILLKNNLSKKFLIGTQLMFFCSGFTSLVYQVIWVRQLSLAVGSTSASLSIVLSIFFLGLAGGSYLVGRFHQKIKNPLTTYAQLEGVIGLYGFVLVYILFHFQSLLVKFYPDGDISFLSQSFKFFLVFLLLILPTLAMGATLPLLVKAFEQKGADKRQSVSLMYGINTLGAVAGSMASGFFLIPRFGVELSNHFAVILNLVLLGSAWLLGRQPFGGDTVAPIPHQRASEVGLPATITASTASTASIAPKQNSFYLPSRRFLLLGIAASCGFATISAEVVWNKYLGIFMGTNIYGLSLLLSILLLGIGLGSILLPKARRAFNSLSNEQFLLALSFMLLLGLWLSTRLLGNLPFLTAIASYYLGTSLSLLQIKSFATAAILFFPTFISGMILPLTIELISEDSRDLPQATSWVYSLNTVGAIAGSYLSGLVLVPLIGSAWTIKLALNLLILCLFALIFQTITLRRQRIWIWSLLVTATLGINSMETLQFKDIIRSAYFQTFTDGSQGASPDVLKFFSDKQEEFIKIIEGETAVISLSHDKADGPEYRKYFRLKTNGLNESVYDSSNRDALPKYEALLGLLPYTLMEKPEKAFMVGYGGGFSTHFLGSTDLKKVMVAELEKGIIEAADFVWQGQNPILQHPNVQLKIEDARFLLAVGHGAPYDIIASQPSHSWLSGVANLFTLEFFELVKSRLSAKGIFSQWLNLYNMDEAVLKSILKTFYTVFPHGAVFTDPNDDEVILIGSLTPLHLDLDRATEILGRPALQPLFANLAIKNGYDLLTHLTITRERALEIATDSVLNTDRNAYAETRQSHLFYHPQNRTVQDFLNEQFQADYDQVVPASAPLVYSELLKSLNLNQNFSKYNKVLDDKKTELHNWQDLALAYYQVERYASALKIIEQNKFNLHTTDDLNLTLQILLASAQHRRLTDVYEAFNSKTNFYSSCLALESYLNQRTIKGAKKAALLLEKNSDRALRECGDYYYYYLGHYYHATGEQEKAMAYLDHFYKSNPQHLEGIKFLIGSLIASDLNSSSEEFMKEYLKIRQQEKERLITLSNFYRSHNALEDATLLNKKLELM